MVKFSKELEAQLIPRKKEAFVNYRQLKKPKKRISRLPQTNRIRKPRSRQKKSLRPQQHEDSHMVTFFVDDSSLSYKLFTMCFVFLFCVYVILAHLCGIFSPSSGKAYMETIYPVFSVSALLSLHLFMFGCNLFMWTSTGIKYDSIFDLSPALKHWDAFLISVTFMTAVVGAMVVHLLLRAAGFSPGQVDAIPGIPLLLFTALLICPFDIFYHPTRSCFIRVIRNIVCSPFYKVHLIHLFMADQLTSQIPLLRYLEITGCHFFGKIFKTYNHEVCHSGGLYTEITYIISFLPYYWRAMQCARRWFDDSDVNHLANMGKYVSAMVAAGARVIYDRQEDHLWFAVVLITSVVATVYQLYWDFVKDWGFLNPNSRNPFLRDYLILKNKSARILHVYCPECCLESGLGADCYTSENGVSSNPATRLFASFIGGYPAGTLEFLQVGK